MKAPHIGLTKAAAIAIVVAALIQSPADAQSRYGFWSSSAFRYYDPLGNHYSVSPGRLWPGTNVPRPGTFHEDWYFVPGRGWGYSQRWIDMYGVPRGNFVVPGPFGTYGYSAVSARTSVPQRQQRPATRPTR
jgi:hypothetical protein